MVNLSDQLMGRGEKYFESLVVAGCDGGFTSNYTGNFLAYGGVGATFSASGEQVSPLGAQTLYSVFAADQEIEVTTGNYVNGCFRIILTNYIHDISGTDYLSANFYVTTEGDMPGTDYAYILHGTRPIDGTGTPFFRIGYNPDAFSTDIKPRYEVDTNGNALDIGSTTGLLVGIYYTPVVGPQVGGGIVYDWTVGSAITDLDTGTATLTDTMNKVNEILDRLRDAKLVTP